MDPLQPFDRLVHVPGGGDEHQRVDPRVLGERVPVGGGGFPGQMIQVVMCHAPFVQPRTRRRAVLHVHRVQGGGTVHHLDRSTVADPLPQPFGEPGGVQGGGHGHQHQILAQLVDLTEHPEEQIRLQIPLMDLVQDDRAHTGQLRVSQQPVHQHSGREELDQGALPGAPLPAHRVAHLISQGATVQVGQPGGRGPGGDAARLGDDDPRR